MLHASSDWVTSVTLTAPPSLPLQGYLQPLTIDNQQTYQHHFQAHLRQTLRPAVCAQYQKAEQEQKSSDNTFKNWLMPRENGSRIVSKWVTTRRSLVCSPNLRQKPLVRQLLLFLDDTNVIRFGKRVHNALVSKSTKFLLLRHQCHAC